MYFKNFYTDYLSFLVNPLPYTKTRSTSKKSSAQQAQTTKPTIKSLYTKYRKPIWYIIHSTWLSLVIGFLLSSISHFTLLSLGYNSEDNNSVVEFVNTNPLLQILFAVAVIAPLLEEACFRLFLTSSKQIFTIGLAACTLIIFNYITNLTIYGIVAGLMMVIILITLFTPQKTIQALLQKHFRFLVWFSTICFALVHLFNYENITPYWYLIPLIVSTQFVSGTFYSFIRLKFGFYSGILMHSVFNTVVIIIVQFYQAIQ